MKPDDPLPGTGDSVARSLLRRHRMYLPLVAPGLRSLPVHAMAHITGGGIPGNLPRVLPAGLRARVDRRAWEVPPIFRAIQRAGTVDESEMLHVFNMGIGFILVVPAGTERAWLQTLTEAGEAPVRLGVIERGDGGVVWEGMAGAAPSD